MTLSILFALAISSPNTAEDPLSPAVNPKWQVAFDRGGSIWLANGDGSHLRRLITNGEKPKWSPNGKFLAFLRGREIRILEVENSKQHLLGRANLKDGNGWGEGISLDWDPKRPALLCGTQRGYSLTVYDLALTPELAYRGKILGRQAGGMTSPTYSPCWSPSGKHLAFVRGGDIWVANRDESRMFEDPDAWSQPVGAFQKPILKGLRKDWIDTISYYNEANRIAATALFNDAEIGASGVTPYWANELAWTQDERKLIFSFQRIGGSGTAEIGFLTLSPSREDDRTSALFHVEEHWLEGNGLWSPRICPDGKTLSFVEGWNGDADLKLSDWTGKHTRLLMGDARYPDWRPVNKP